jgi:hypothetical protein
MNSAYIAVDADRCFREQHHMAMFGSDKTPMKRSLECLNCTAAMGRTAIVAYGIEQDSFGSWRVMRRREEEPLTEVIE